MVVARGGVPVQGETDVRWARAAEAGCARWNVRLLAVAVATLTGVFRLGDFDSPVG